MARWGQRCERCCTANASVVSRSAEGLARMITVIDEVLREFGLTLSEEKPEVLVMRVKEESGSPSHPPLIIEAAGQGYAQTTHFRYLGALLTEHGELNPVISWNIEAAWARFRKYARELFDRPGAPFRFKTRLL